MRPIATLHKCFGKGGEHPLGLGAGVSHFVRKKPKSLCRICQPNDVVKELPAGIANDNVVLVPPVGLAPLDLPKPLHVVGNPIDCLARLIRLSGEKAKFPPHRAQVLRNALHVFLKALGVNDGI